MNNTEKDIKRFLIPMLRRASMRFKIKTENGYEYPRTQVKQAARVERGLYKCAACGESFKEKDTVVDHIDSVVPLEHEEHDWNNFINRLFVTHDKLQILCNPCHDCKSLIEDNLRTAARQKLKAEEKALKKEEKRLAKLNKKV